VTFRQNLHGGGILNLCQLWLMPDTGFWISDIFAFSPHMHCRLSSIEYLSEEYSQQKLSCMHG
jgi:hypothetical protein